MARKNDRQKKVRDGSRAMRGLDRKAHFAAGGSTAEWRGLHTVTKNAKREASRKACRRPCREE